MRRLIWAFVVHMQQSQVFIYPRYIFKQYEFVPKTLCLLKKIRKTTGILKFTFMVSKSCQIVSVSLHFAKLPISL